MGSASHTEDETLAASFKFGSSFVDASKRQTPLRTFLFGYKLARTLAPLLHSTLFNGISVPWTYKVHETQDASEFLPALKKSDIVGCAVTMPFKVKMMSEVDDVTDEGRVIGAINTVFLRKALDGSTRYIGTNTDCVGVREAFQQNHPDIVQQAQGKPAMVIGAGGACRAAIYALSEWLGASEIYLVNRLDDEVDGIVNSLKESGFTGKLVHVKSIEQAAALETPALVVGCVPDFPPQSAGEILAREISNHFLNRSEKGCILEMCYFPRPRTELYELGASAGWAMIYGTEAMIWQGVAQQILWSELPIQNFKLTEAKDAIAKALLAS
ncbi:unnamed protein product [Clonostachys rosea]|uniref:Shikimate dehydrogenase substrate binding N-terminal domain-containing protein n=1 Tax=Bionectria ochroleuca TaxID=29856 RepID=A0ABY6U4R6_BIOOC|nr:unnamed protein product [Clonostachys rosea]